MACTTVNRADVHAQFVRAAIAALDTPFDRFLARALGYRGLTRRLAIINLVAVAEELEQLAAAPDTREALARSTDVNLEFVRQMNAIGRALGLEPPCHDDAILLAIGELHARAVRPDPAGVPG